MIFNEEEMVSRRQFHELFCTKYLYTGEKKDAINEDSWNNIVINDILHTLYENNVLTPQDIETMMQLGGMYNHNHETYFHYHAGTPIFKEVLSAMSPFITQAAFVRFKQLLNGRSMDSVAEFIQRCCNNTHAEMIGVSSVELYELYCTWCALNRFPVSARHVLYARMSAVGFKRKKGYLNGACGITYFMVRMNREEVLTDAQPEGAQTEEGQEPDSVQSFRNVSRAGAKVRKEPVIKETPDVLPDEVGQDIAAGSGGDLAEHVEDGAVSETADISNTPDEVDGPTIDTDTEDTVIQLPEDKDGVLTEAHPEGTGTDIQARVKKLPMELRQCFKLLKATYRISPEHFTEEDFNQSVSALDASVLQEDQTLYDLFLEYAKNK